MFHRPQYFPFGTDENAPGCQAVKGFLVRQCDRLIRQHGVRHFISGGAVGVDTWAMEAVIALRKTHRHIFLGSV